MSTEDMENLTKLVRREIETYIHSPHSAPNKVDAYCMYFNNFHINLPFGGRKEQMERCNLLDSRNISGGRKTPRQFLTDIESAVKDAGIDFDELERLQQQEKCAPSKDKLIKRKELFELVFPAYIILRQRGYSWEDLT